MDKPVREIKYFLFGQAFTDGLRTMLSILLPSLILSFYGQLALGMTISLGALCVSVTDAPGPILNKRNTMLYCLLFLFITAFITGFARLNIYLLGLEVLLFSFLFSMFGVYGARAGAVGSASLLALILIMDQPLQPNEVLWNSLLIVAGGLWYTIISLLFHFIMPYRPAQRALGESVRELARFVSIKADFYNPATNLKEDYEKLVAQQIVVNEKQDIVREHLFKTRQIVKETTTTSSALLLAFVDTVDLFEDVTATYYDYKSIRERYNNHDVLKKISLLIKQVADELDHIGVAIQSNTGYKKSFAPEMELDAIKKEIDKIGESGTSNIVLKKILVNIRKLVQRIDDITGYFDPRTVNTSGKLSGEFHRFVTHQSFDPQIFLDNLTFNSSIFRHSLRVAIACIIGFAIAKLIAYGHHTYWILLTIAFILKPAYSLTKQRNVERIIGTVAGGIIGVLILVFIPNTTVQFVLMLIFMLGTYTFQRTNYIAMVIFVTPFVLILFKFVGAGFIDVAQERVLDTVIGCAIAFTASYLLFPTWEFDQIKFLMRDMLKANISYLQIFAEKMAGQDVKAVDYKLARKNVYVHSANLSAAFQRMLSEPKKKQKNKNDMQQFVVLNHILFSNIASLTSGSHKQRSSYPDAVVRLIKRSHSALCHILTKLDGSCAQNVLQGMGDEGERPATTADDLLLKDQLEYIVKISKDIEKITDRIISDAETTQ